jgi:hypothetical protein
MTIKYINQSSSLSICWRLKKNIIWINMIYRIALIFFAITFSYLELPTYAEDLGCSQINYHKKAGRTNICNVEWPEYFKVLVNWGTKPEWIDSSHFVFVSNQIGDIFMMDIISREITKLTGHFPHAGFTRAFKLNNGDLLLLGPRTGPQPPEDPLVLYDIGRFSGELWVLRKPYNESPIPLGIHAWEGIAVSRESNRIAWSNTNHPFFSSNIFKTGWLYFFGKSQIMTGYIEYDKNGIPTIKNSETVLKKWHVGPVSLEPQNFLGKNDEKLLVSSYGPFENLSSLLILDLKTKRYNRVWDCFTYQEWEGIRPGYSAAFVEKDDSLFLMWGFDFVELYLYHFDEDNSDKKLEQVTYFERNYKKQVYVHDPVFSEDGSLVLMTTASASDSAPSSPGYGIGIVLFDYEKFRHSNPR